MAVLVVLQEAETDCSVPAQMHGDKNKRLKVFITQGHQAISAPYKTST